MRGMSSQAITQWGGHIRPQPTHTAVLSAAKYSGVLLIWERDAPLLRIEDYLLFPLSLLYVRRLIVVLAPDNVFVLLLVVARMVGLGLVPNVTPSLPNQYGVGGWDLKSYVDYCWFSLKRQRLLSDRSDY